MKCISLLAAVMALVVLGGCAAVPQYPSAEPWALWLHPPQVAQALKLPPADVDHAKYMTTVINANRDFLIKMVTATACVDSESVNYLNRYAVPGPSTNWNFIPPRVSIGADQCVNVTAVTDWKYMSAKTLLFRVYYVGPDSGRTATRGLALMQMQDGRWLTFFSPYR